MNRSSGRSVAAYMYHNEQLTTGYYERTFLNLNKTLNKLSTFFENAIVFVFMVLLILSKKFQILTVIAF